MNSLNGARRVEEATQSGGTAACVAFFLLMASTLHASFKVNDTSAHAVFLYVCMGECAVSSIAVYRQICTFMFPQSAFHRHLINTKQPLFTLVITQAGDESNFEL